MSVVQLVFAHSNGAFGNGSKLPWNHCSEDMKFFQTVTVDTITVMGKATWESIGSKPLPNRVNVVLSNSTVAGADLTMIGTLRGVIKTLKTMYPNKTISIIGGLSLIKEAVGIADVVYMTELHPYLPLQATHYVQDAVDAINAQYKLVMSSDVRLQHKDIRSLTFLHFHKCSK